MKSIFIILVFTFIAITSQACRCAFLSFSEEAEQADQIFIGMVLKKVKGDGMYYYFSLLQIFKGDATDTITIKTGLGGGDCGAEFEVGKSYVVYAKNKETNRCRRNSLADRSTDLGKLKYVFINGYSDSIGKTTNPVLIDKEADYFNSEFINQRDSFDFHGKKVAFIFIDGVVDKKQYFIYRGGKDAFDRVIILTEEERKETGGYDAIIASIGKQNTGNRYRRNIIKQID